MSTVKNRWLLAGLVCAVIAVPSMTYAHVHVGIGFGTHIGCGPYYGWYDPWWDDPWYDPWYYPYGPVVVGPPVVVEKHVVVHEPPLPRPLPQGPTLSKDQQQRRSELLERLRISDVDSRIKAAQDLIQFADDTKTREALERAVRSDHDAAVRKAAVEALAKQSGKKAVAALKRAYAEDANRDVSQAAYKALIMIEGY
jgi:hypothetical protein